MSPSQEAIKQLFAAYDAAIVSAVDPVDGWVDPALVCLQRGQSAVVLTAWNPGFDRPEDHVNRQRNAQLYACLLAEGCQVWRADGFDPDGSISEEGFLAWGMTVERGLDIARDFGQFAIYAYDCQGLRRVVAC